MEFGPLNLVLTARCHAVPIAYLKAPPFEGWISSLEGSNLLFDSKTLADKKPLEVS